MGTSKFIIFLLAPTASVLPLSQPRANPRGGACAQLSVHPETNHGVPGAQAVRCIGGSGEVGEPALSLPVLPPVVALPDHEVHDCGLFPVLR